MSREINGRPQGLAEDLAAAARRARENGWEGRREHSQLPPAGQVAPAGAGRVEFFTRLRVPMQNGTGDPGKVK